MVAPSLGGMPLMIEEVPIQAPETGPCDPAGSDSERDEDELQAETRCRCDSGEPAARDEMWVRWA